MDNKKSRRSVRSGKLANHYYSTGGYWKGYDAVDKLSDVADKEVAKKWLEKQALWQIYLPRPQYIPRWHWNVEKVNQVHQADLLFLPHDTVSSVSDVRRRVRKTYKYALVVVDVASRYIDAEPLTSKYATEVAEAFKKIYSRKLKQPETVIVDPGTEFMGDVKKMNIQKSEVNNHRAQSLVERANRTIAEKLFSYQYAQEMLKDGERSREWVKRLPAVIKGINSGVKRITGKAPAEAIKLTEVKENHVNYKRPVGLEEKRLPAGVRVRYLYQPGEYEGGRQRATDPVWSMDVYDVVRTVVGNNQPVLYYLSSAEDDSRGKGAPKRNFVREELQVVPKDTQMPPDSVL